MSRVTRIIQLAILCALSFPLLASNNLAGPPDHDGSIEVEIGFFLTNINNISEEDETFDFEGMLSLHWKDPRLSFDPAQTGYDQEYYQGSYQVNEVYGGWWPQVFMANEAGRFDRQGVVLRVTPDGSVFYTEEIDAIAKTAMQLQRFPFDQQQFVILFEVLGLNKSQVVLLADPATSGIWQNEQHEVHIPQWQEPELTTTVVEYDPVYADGQDEQLTALKVTIDIERDPWYMLRLVVLPVLIFVFLSWSVFWMDRSSVGDRMDISFIGILTVVAYQIMFSESLPKISYITVLMSFMIISFLMMCANVMVNLRVASHDKHGRIAQGDRLDKRCRYIFPPVYLLGSFLVGLYIYLTG